MATVPEDPTPEIGLEFISQVASSPRRISVDGIDYGGQDLTQLTAFYRFLKSNEPGVGSACNGFRSTRLIRQTASPPSALGVHLGHCSPGGRVW